jgi:hypothetical protein
LPKAIQAQFTTKGPFTITRVFNNGTVQFDRNGFLETINIRRIKPFLT